MEKGKDLSKVSPFLINKAITGRTGPLVSIWQAAKSKACHYRKLDHFLIMLR